MFFAIRDAARSKGRFASIIVVVTLLAVMVCSLTSLAAGLASQNISAITSIPDKTILAAIPDKTGASLSDSALNAGQVDAALAGNPGARPLGIATAPLVAGENSTVVTAFGGDDVPRGEIDVPTKAATEMGVGVGDEVMVKGAPVRVRQVTPDTFYSHMPVAHISLADWRAITRDSKAGEASAILVTGEAGDQAGMKSYTTISVLPHVGAFRSEIGSLGMMIGLLLVVASAICAMFFLTWISQRARQYSILKAIGASTSVLVRDACAQVVVVLGVGIALGSAITAEIGALASGAGIPFLTSTLTVGAPALVLLVFGFAGAALALRSIITARPLDALKGA